MVLDPESEHIREVYAHFGLAFYHANCLERTLVITLCGPYYVSQTLVPRGRYEELTDTYSAETFGNLVSYARSSGRLPEDVALQLDKAVEMRNWLAHRYWWDRAGELFSLEGRNGMLKELSEISQLFEGLDEYFVPICKDWGHRNGITDDLILELQEELLSNPSPGDPPRSRRLRKQETIVGAYLRSAADIDGEVLLFETADGCLWYLGDFGLTYGPEQRPNDAELRPCERLSQALPAKCKSKVQGGQPWQYEIALSSGWRIKVMGLRPSERGQVYRWRVVRDA